MSKSIDMTGQQIGYIKVLSKYGSNSQGQTMWKCLCTACGKEYITTGKQLRRKAKIKSCGCISSKPKDITGMRFGKLIAIERVGSKNNQALWKCKCDCGKDAYVTTAMLMCGNNTSCGCSQFFPKGKDNPKATHLLTNTRLYAIYCGMKDRCYNPNNKHYDIYGGRGIEICPEWLDDFMIFKKWADSMGYDENSPKGTFTIERKDVNGNYCPQNCKWIKINDQAKNKQKTLRFTINGETKTLLEWCEIYKIKPSIVYHRLYMGISIENALSYPVIRGRKDKIPRG